MPYPPLPEIITATILSECEVVTGCLPEDICLQFHQLVQQHPVNVRATCQFTTFQFVSITINVVDEV